MTSEPRAPRSAASRTSPVDEAKRRLALRLRAEDLPSGGQRVVAQLPELGVEEVLGESPAPFICQTTLRPWGAEPFQTARSEYLDVWCGPKRVASIHSRDSKLTLGKQDVAIPPGSSVPIKKVPQLPVPGATCEPSEEQVDVRLVARGREIFLEVPQLRFSRSVRKVARGSKLGCTTSISPELQLMEFGCSTTPQPLHNQWFQVVSGALIVEETWPQSESSQHYRWGIRLPCGRVKFRGVAFQDAFYGARTCTERCLEKVTACQSKCPPSNESDACADGCYALEGRCLRGCAD